MVCSVIIDLINICFGAAYCALNKIEEEIKDWEGEDGEYYFTNVKPKIHYTIDTLQKYYGDY